MVNVRHCEIKTPVFKFIVSLWWGMDFYIFSSFSNGYLNHKAHASISSVQSTRCYRPQKKGVPEWYTLSHYKRSGKLKLLLLSELINNHHQKFFLFCVRLCLVFNNLLVDGVIYGLNLYDINACRHVGYVAFCYSFSRIVAADKPSLRVVHPNGT